MRWWKRNKSICVFMSIQIGPTYHNKIHKQVIKQLKNVNNSFKLGLRNKSTEQSVSHFLLHCEEIYDFKGHLFKQLES